MAAKLDYDRLASAYGPNRRTHPGVLAALVTTGWLGAASRVLEVGCGTGNYVAALADEVGCAVAGLDPSPAMLRQAAEQAPWIPLHQGRAETLPFADGAFDLIFSVDVIHHVEDRPAFFREAFRVLEPGGSLCTATDSEDDIRRRVPLSSHFPETVAVELRRYPSISTLQAETSAAGFGDVREERVERPYLLTDIDGYRARAYSSLHLIEEAAWRRGVVRLESDLAAGPIAALSLYTLLWSEWQSGHTNAGSPIRSANGTGKRRPLPRHPERSEGELLEDSPRQVLQPSVRSVGETHRRRTQEDDGVAVGETTQSTSRRRSTHD